MTLIDLGTAHRSNMPYYCYRFYQEEKKVDLSTSLVDRD